jgi:hypothetical protein
MVRVDDSDDVTSAGFLLMNWTNWSELLERTGGSVRWLSS